MQTFRFVLLCAALLPLAAAVSRTRPEEQQQQLSAADDHEARAQQSLADMIQDAIAMLKHGSLSAKEQAAGGIAQMAVETTISQPFHPLTFRNACVKAGVIDQLVLLLAAIATDDPSTELDNGHALAACNAGAVPPVVRHLVSGDQRLQVAAAACVAVLAENPVCQTLLLANGAVNPLITLSSYGSDAAKLRAIAALDQLALNNPAAHEAIAQGGGLKLLKGVQRFGGETLREATADLLRGVEAPDTLTVAVDTASHARQAHQARLKHSKVWRGATPVARAQAPQQMMQSGESTGP
ncbi:hypothetical protein Ctob_012494 [Chrysochromulina tobinii]|uniref:Uncharacterized protein n=1 Tax=Chrysochromulina tobinii TaxID=1460289 RepID=A0A0M0JIB3_9EUKA|nr:hypothetical protein Ctob_012494 [Chrysochromulina tobinii]|eukprot:KOO26351.1 hypothetical protein Ctob_012494 [Chrysochromulina sp. CCMP291]